MTPPPLPSLRDQIDAAIPVMSGFAAFGATLAISTLAQNLAGISTATKVLPTVGGFVTVCAASLASERTAILIHEWMKDPKAFQKNPAKRIRERLLATSSNPSRGTGQHHQPHNIDDIGSIHLKQNQNRGYSEYWRMGNAKFPIHEVRICLLGLVTFTALGGRFWAISPSSYTHIGSFARKSIPCSPEYASSAQRAKLEKMFRKWGCHTCGSTSQSVGFHADHMPPKSVANEMNKTWLRSKGILREVQFRFYPQCVHCSKAQGSILKQATSQVNKSIGHLSSTARAAFLKNAGGGTKAHFHGLKFRMNHLTGAVLAGTTVIGASDREIRNGNPKRLEWVQHQIQGFIKNQKS